MDGAYPAAPIKVAANKTLRGHYREKETMKEKAHPGAKIEIAKNGPYLVSGGLPLSEQQIVINAEGESLEYKEGKKYPAKPQYALCRCGQSSNKPFCDGSHVQF